MEVNNTKPIVTEPATLQYVRLTLCALDCTVCFSWCWCTVYNYLYTVHAVYTVCTLSTLRCACASPLWLCTASPPVHRTATTITGVESIIMAWSASAANGINKLSPCCQNPS